MHQYINTELINNFWMNLINTVFKNENLQEMYKYYQHANGHRLMKSKQSSSTNIPSCHRIVHIHTHKVRNKRWTPVNTEGRFTTFTFNAKFPFLFHLKYVLSFDGWQQGPGMVNSGIDYIFVSIQYQPHNFWNLIIFSFLLSQIQKWENSVRFTDYISERKTKLLSAIATQHLPNNATLGTHFLIISLKGGNAFVSLKDLSKCPVEYLTCRCLWKVPPKKSNQWDKWKILRCPQ